MSILPKILWIRGEAVLCINGATLQSVGYLKVLKMDVITFLLKTEIDVKRYLESDLPFFISLP